MRINDCLSRIQRLRVNYRKLLSIGVSVIALAVMLGSLWFAFAARHTNIEQDRRLQMMRDVIATTDCAFIVVDKNGYIVEWGPGAETLFGWKQDEVWGSTLSFLVAGPDKSKYITSLYNPPAQIGVAYRLTAMDCWMLRKDGVVLPVHVIASMFVDEVGTYYVALMSIRSSGDITIVIPKPAVVKQEMPVPRAIYKPRLVHPTSSESGDTK